MNNGSYTDWKLGVTKDLKGWIFGLSAIGTNAKGDCSPTAVNQPYCFTNGQFNGAVPDKTKDAGRSTLVVSVMKTF